MKYCIPIPCFFGGMPVADAIRKISSLGFQYVENYNWNRDLLPYADEIKAACAETGVTFLSTCTSEFRLTDTSFRQKWLDGCLESCQACKTLGIGKMITQVGNDTGADRAVQHENIVTTLKEAKPILEEYGIVMMIEPLNPLIDHKGYYLWKASEAFDIVHEVDSPFVKVVYDIYHQQVSEGDIIRNATGNLDCIAHFHCAGHPGRTDLQLGELDYKNVFAAIDRTGYSGACGLEYGTKMGAENSLRTFRKIYC